MRRKFWKRRTLIIAAFTVALSIGIVFTSIPYLPHPIIPHSSITNPVTRKIPAGTSAYPGHSNLNLPALSNNESFAVKVTVTNGTADFCAIQDSVYMSWLLSGNPSDSTFPRGYCIIEEKTAYDTLAFLPTSPGNWDVVALNYNPTQITVVYSPA